VLTWAQPETTKGRAMAAVMFDTQKFVKRLQEAKFPPEQAEA